METQNQQLKKIITLFVKVSAKPASVEVAKKALLDDVHGAWTEPGNYKMELYSALGQPENYYLFERWESQGALEAHFQQPYTAGAFGLQNGHLKEDIQMNYLTDLLPRPQDKQPDHKRKANTTLIVPFQVKPGRGNEFAELFKAFVPLVRTEPGNVDFNFHHVNGQDDKFVLYERWLSQEFLDKHNQLQATSDFVAKVSPLLTAPVYDFVLFAKDISGY
jgi:quinol monooxygenase YgiN